MTIIFYWILQILWIPALAPLFLGIMRKVKAHLQMRSGADIVQPYRDLWKLFHKDEVISIDASWVFRSAPYLIFAVLLVVGAIIPIFVGIIQSAISDLLLVVYLFALSTFILALAGMDTGSAFGGFGSSREMTIAALTEGGLLFSLLVGAFLAGTTNLYAIADFISTLPFSAFIPVMFAFAAFTIALLAETAHFPFDNPTTHLELTMIHEAMILEYSGKRLALIEWAAANKFLIFLTLGANLFFPTGFSPFDVKSGIVFFAVYLAKILIISISIAILESAIAKFRFFRLPDLLFTSFILSVIGLILIL